MQVNGITRLFIQTGTQLDVITIASGKSQKVTLEPTVTIDVPHR